MGPDMAKISGPKLAKRLPWGSGSIRGPDAEGRYDVRLSLGARNGKRRVRSRVATLAQARSKLEELQFESDPPSLGKQDPQGVVRSGSRGA